MEVQRYGGFNAVPKSKPILVTRILKFPQRTPILTFISIVGNYNIW